MPSINNTLGISSSEAVADGRLASQPGGDSKILVWQAADLVALISNSLGPAKAYESWTVEVSLKITAEALYDTDLSFTPRFQASL